MSLLMTAGDYSFSDGHQLPHCNLRSDGIAITKFWPFAFWYKSPSHAFPSQYSHCLPLCIYSSTQWPASGAASIRKLAEASCSESLTIGTVTHRVPYNDIILSRGGWWVMRSLNQPGIHYCRCWLLAATVYQALMIWQYTWWCIRHGS